MSLQDFQALDKTPKKKALFFKKTTTTKVKFSSEKEPFFSPDPTHKKSEADLKTASL